VGRFVPRCCRGIYDDAPRTRWGREYDCRKTRCLILQNESAIGILGGIDELSLWRKQQKVLDMRVPRDIPEGVKEEDLGKRQ